MLYVQLNHNINKPLMCGVVRERERDLDVKFSNSWLTEDTIELHRSDWISFVGR